METKENVKLVIKQQGVTSGCHVKFVMVGSMQVVLK